MLKKLIANILLDSDIILIRKIKIFPSYKN